MIMAFVPNSLARLTFRSRSLIPVLSDRRTLSPTVRTRLAHTTRVRTMASEQGVSPPVDISEPTIFDKILSKEIPSTAVYEDDVTYAFRDINPQAPVHVLVIPKRRIPMLSMVQPSDKEVLGHLLLTAAKVAEVEGLEEGYRVLINNGKDGLQSVYHLHLHVIGGRELKWGPF